MKMLGKVKENCNRHCKLLKNDKLLLVLLVTFLTYIISFLLLRYIKFDYNYNFGYLDHQLYWEALHRLLNGQVFYRDFYWEYGPLYLIYSLPLFVLLKQTFGAYIFIRLIFLPLTGIVLAFFLGRELLKGKYLVLFLLISAMYSTLNFTTIRHLIAEFGLVLTLLGLYSGDRKKVIRGSVFLGISFTAGVEYAAISIIVLTIYTIWHVYHKGKSIDFRNLAAACSGPLVAGTLFFGYLFVNGALGNYINFFKEFSTSFFYLSPCRSGFPKLNLEIFTSLPAFRRSNLFAIPLLNLSTFIYLFVKERKRRVTPVLLTLLLFSGFAYFRTMINPCLNTASYSITLLLLVLVYTLEIVVRKKLKIVVYIVIIWLLLLSAPNGPMDLVEVLFRKSDVETEYLEKAGIYLDKDKVSKIRPVVDYIKDVTNEGDYVYVYPYGPYNQLTNTTSPVSVIISTHYELAPFLVPKVIENLESKKPEFIIVNRVNAWSYLASMYLIPQSTVAHGDVPIFVADLTDVEKYISQNYTIDKRFDQIWVLKRRESPVEYTPPYISKEVNIVKTKLTNYESMIELQEAQKLFVTGPNPEIVYVKFPVRANLGLSKYTSQYLIQAYLFTTSGQLLGTRADIMSSNWQKLWMEIRNDEKLQEGALFILRLSDNKGFFSLGGAPRSIQIKEPEFFQFNPILFEK